MTEIPRTVLSVVVVLIVVIVFVIVVVVVVLEQFVPRATYVLAVKGW